MTQMEKLQEISVSLAKSDFYPSISCGASYGKIIPFAHLNQIDPSRNVYDDAKIFINASWNIFSGFSTTQKVKQAQSDRISYSETKKHTIDQLDVNVVTTCEQLATARKQMESAHALNRLADKAYSVAKAGYELGLTPFIDVQSRKLDLENARLTLNNAQYSYTNAVIDIQVLTGEFN
jgi:outer membrane protein TolC